MWTSHSDVYFEQKGGKVRIPTQKTKQEKLGFLPKKSKEKFGLLPKKPRKNMDSYPKKTRKHKDAYHVKCYHQVKHRTTSTDFSTFPATGLTHHAAGAQHEVPPQKEPLPAIFCHEEGAQKAVFWRGQPVNPSDSVGRKSSEVFNFFFKHDNIPDWSFAGDFVRKHSFLALHITKQPAGDHKVKNRSFDETFKCLPSVEETFKRKEDYASES